jgi:outer membrane protein OmpA-like peptidoglycan-associated protein
MILRSVLVGIGLSLMLQIAAAAEGPPTTEPPDAVPAQSSAPYAPASAPAPATGGGARVITVDPKPVPAAEGAPTPAAPTVAAPPAAAPTVAAPPAATPIVAAPANPPAAAVATPVKKSCSDIGAALAEARKAGKLGELPPLYAKATGPAYDCTPKAIFCLGRSVALAHVEAAYAKAEKGDAAGASALFQTGHGFGEPWPLLVGLGDGLSEKARLNHNAKLWSEASFTYQKAIAALSEPVLCDDEPAPPAPEALDRISLRMATAMLLAQPVTFFRSKCAPCSMAFLAHLSGSALKTQALPITFKDSSAELTPEGLEAAKALIDCVLRQNWAKLSVSAHTDERGSPQVNAALSGKRLDSLKKLFDDAGYKGRFEPEPKGKSEPFRLENAKGFTPDEIRRLNRRVELRDIPAASAGQCTADLGTTP